MPETIMEDKEGEEYRLSWSQGGKDKAVNLDTDLSNSTFFAYMPNLDPPESHATSNKSTLRAMR